MAYDVFKHGFTQSMLSSFRTCPAKARFQTMGLVPVEGSVTSALTFGVMYHASIETILTMVRDGVLDEVEDAQAYVSGPRWEEDIRRQCPEYFLPTLTADEQQVVETSLAMLQPVMEGYLNECGYMFMGSEALFTVISLEREFVVDLGVGIPFRGKCDGIIRRNSDGALFMLEHKTKGQFDPEALELFLCIDLQTNLYIKAAETWCDGEKITGVLYNVVRRPQLRRKAAETLTDFSSRIRSDVADRTDHYFLELVHETDREQFDRLFALNEVDIIRFRAWALAGEKKDQLHTHSCMAMYGTCAYLNYCASGRSNQVGLVQKSEIFPELSDAASE